MIRPDELQRMACVWRAMPDRDRAIFGAVRFEDLDYIETARRHDCTVAEVESTIARVLLALDRAVNDDLE